MNAPRVPHIPENAPFTQEQRAWLNGFLAGLFSYQEMDPQTAPATEQHLQPLTILFGTQTGTCETLAKQFAKQAGKRGFAPTVYDMAEYPKESLASESQILVVASTYGDGDPPDPVKEFWEWLNSEQAPKLEQLNYSVLALGDTNYEKFCQFGRNLDQRFEELGASRIIDRTDCDVDYEEPSEQWFESVLPKLDSGNGTVLDVKPEDTEPEIPVYSRKNPFHAPLKRVINLCESSSTKDIRHVELSLYGSGLTYEVGDSLGVVPCNSPQLVDEMIHILNFNPDMEIETPKDGTMRLRDALINRYDITKLHKNFLKWIGEKTNDQEIINLIKTENKNALDEYMWGRQIIDLLIDHADASISAEELISQLKPLQPRLYSISSSIKAHPEEVHLTVGVVKYETYGRDRRGVCSDYLSDQLEIGSEVPVYVNVSKNFRLPEDGHRAMIMIGPGTGIAPFRAFLEERKLMGAKGKNWLFFGNPNLCSDFLYKEELQALQREGVLHRLDTAFSRDQEQKIYVQHRIEEQGKELFDWLEDGAHVYVCGDASRMAKDVHYALQKVIAKHSGRSLEQADEYIKNLQSEKRYQRDVY